MARKYLVGPFLCSLAAWTVGNGTVALVPLYAIERGASEAGSGLFLAFAFGCLALGTFAPGLLPKSFSHRRALLAASGVLWVILFLLTSRTATLLQFAAFCGAAYLLAGVVFTQAAVLTGLAAHEKERGTAFGILGMTNGLGSLVGGMGAGWLADRFGFVGLWEGAAGVALLVVVGGVLSLESRAMQPVSASDPPPQNVPLPAPPRSLRAVRGYPFGACSIGRCSRPLRAVNVGLLLLLAANLSLSFTNSTANLGRSLVMDQYGFSKLTINLMQSASGAVGLCISLALGWLSDRVGRRWILVGSFLLTGASIVVLSFSRVLWQFSVYSVLIAFLSVPAAIGPAFVMDVVPREGVARGVSLFQGMFWAGNIAGLVALGFAFERFGTATPILFSALFPVAGMVLLLLIRERRSASVSPASR